MKSLPRTLIIGAILASLFLAPDDSWSQNSQPFSFLDSPAGFFGLPITFSAAPDLEESGYSLGPSQPQVADINGDGKPDLLMFARKIADIGTTGYTSEIRIFINETPGSFGDDASVRGTAPSFRLAPSVPVANHAFGFAALDVDVDGDSDLVVFEQSGTSMLVAVHLGSGDGNFLGAAYSPMAPGSGIQFIFDPSEVKFGDLNSDGSLDLVIPTRASHIVVMLGNGDGTFQIPSLFPANPPGGFSSSIRNLVIADVTGDSILDVLGAQFWYGQLQLAGLDISCINELDTGCVGFGAAVVLKGVGDGSFETPVGFGLRGVIRFGDFTNDGIVDALASNSRACLAHIPYFAVHYPDFQWNDSQCAPWYTLLPGTGTQQIFDASSCAPENFNSLCGLDAGGSSVGELTLILSMPTVARTFEDIPFGADTIAVADINLDGIPDLLGVSGSQTIIPLIANGDGSIQEFDRRCTGFLLAGGCHSIQPVGPLSGNWPARIIVADVSGNRKPDIIIANTAAGSFTVIANSARPTISASIPASIDSSGQVDMVIQASDPDGEIESIIVLPEGFSTINLMDEVVFRDSHFGVEGTVKRDSVNGIGIRILGFLSNSPLQAAGLSVGDLVTRLDGAPFGDKDWTTGPKAVDNFLRRSRGDRPSSVHVACQWSDGPNCVPGTKSISMPDQARALTSQEFNFQYNYGSWCKLNPMPTSVLHEPMILVRDNHSNVSSFTGTVNQVCNRPPTAACRDVTVAADSAFGVSANIDDGSVDPDGDSITLNQQPPGPYTVLGSPTGVTLTVTDVNGAATSCAAIVTVVDTGLPVIADLSARRKTSKAQLVWTDTGAISYNIYRALATGGPYQLIGNAVSTYSTFLDSGLMNGVTYYYIVRPVNGNGAETSESNETSATSTRRSSRR